MTDSRDHHCPRCGTYLPTVTVQKPIYVEHYTAGCGFKRDEVLVRYEEVEEVAECIRCTGGY